MCREGRRTLRNLLKLQFFDLSLIDRSRSSLLILRICLLVFDTRQLKSHCAARYSEVPNWIEENSSWSRSSSRVIVKSTPSGPPKNFYRLSLSFSSSLPCYRLSRTGNVNWYRVVPHPILLASSVDTGGRERHGSTAVPTNQVNSDGRLIGREERGDDGPDDRFKEAKKPSARHGRTGWSTRGRTGRGETRRAHVWHTHRNHRTDGRSVRGGGSVDHLPLVGG